MANTYSALDNNFFFCNQVCHHFHQRGVASSSWTWRSFIDLASSFWTRCDFIILTWYPVLASSWHWRGFTIVALAWLHCRGIGVASPSWHWRGFTILTLAWLHLPDIGVASLTTLFLFWHGNIFMKVKMYFEINVSDLFS
jgi:hypothetical protein